MEDRDLTSDCLVMNTGCLGICDKVPAAAVYSEGTRQDKLDSHYGQDIIVR
jgi:(2Fe-2S) ferredoxin